MELDETATIMTTSRLFDLPTEVRLGIWRLVLLPDPFCRLRSFADVDLEAYRSNYNDAVPCWEPPNTWLNTNLLRTCRQLYGEGLDVLFRSNLFSLTPRSLAQDYVAKIIGRIEHIDLGISPRHLFHGGSASASTYESRCSEIIGQLARVSPKLKNLKIIFNKDIAWRISSCFMADSDMAKTLTHFMTAPARQQMQVIIQYRSIFGFFSKSFLRSTSWLL